MYPGDVCCYLIAAAGASRAAEVRRHLTAQVGSSKASSRSINCGRQIMAHAFDHLQARAGNRLAVSAPQASGTSGSAAPWITSAGQRILRSNGVRSPQAPRHHLPRHARPD
jgi:hypothetical protein